MEKLTRLKAINRMLLGIKLAPVETVDQMETYHEATIANSVLEQVMLDVLSPGWNFNTHRLTLVPEEDGRIPVPPHTIDTFTVGGSIEYLVSNGYLKGILSNSTDIGTPVDLFVVIGFPWEDLPVQLQMLILHQARLAFKLEMKGGASGGGMDNQAILADIRKSEGAAKGWDLRQKRRSALDSLGMRRHVNPNIPRS